MDEGTLLGLLVVVMAGAAWLGPAVVCLFKGKLGLGLVGLLGPIAAAVVAVVTAIVFFAVNENGPGSGYEDLGVLLWALILGFLVLIVGVVVSLVVALVGAIRLARPGSQWARNYDPGKLARAVARHS